MKFGVGSPLSYGSADTTCDASVQSMLQRTWLAERASQLKSNEWQPSAFDPLKTFAGLSKFHQVSGIRDSSTVLAGQDILTGTFGEVVTVDS